MKLRGNTILITGGGSGIGEALAHRLHDLGNVVLIAGRRLTLLQGAAKGRKDIVPLVLDADDPDAIEDFARQTITDHPGLNVLMNNAGIMRMEALDKRRDLGDAEATINTNLLGPIRLTNSFIDHLKTKSDAVIINCTSGLAFVPLVASPTYSATKAAMHAYTVCLREALKGWVEVIELPPPAVQTSLTPGQETRTGYMPLSDFADEVVSIMSNSPTPSELLVKRVEFLRLAEQEGRFATALAAVNGQN